MGFNYWSTYSSFNKKIIKDFNKFIKKDFFLAHLHLGNCFKKIYSFESQIA